jgi:hypothetical protein
MIRPVNGGPVVYQKNLSEKLQTYHKSRVPHISLVFREMWDTTALNSKLCPLVA